MKSLEMKGIPHIAFGKETLLKLPELGPTSRCPKCGKEVEVKDHGMIQTIICCRIGYVVGVAGRDVFGVKPDVSEVIECGRSCVSDLRRARNTE